MLHINKKAITLSLATLGILVVGCGSSDDSSALTSYTAPTTVSGQLIDGYVAGAYYICADGVESITTLNGEFSCDALPVTFKVGDITLGEVTNLPDDKHVFPQDLVGVDRSDTNNSQVLAMAQLLQSLDSDQNPDNGIDINASTLEQLSTEEDFDAYNLNTYITQAGVTEVNATQAHAHLENSMHTLETIDSLELPYVVQDSLNSITYELSDSLKNDIAYMGNEERLAYDIYNALFALYPAQTQLDNIAQTSEIQHIASVKALVTKYALEESSLNIRDVDTTTLSSSADINSVAGVYDIQVIQDLYAALLEKGQNSATDALQVGCMVEVTDINDLDRSIIDAEETNANDVVETFNFLRDASYSHYWSFDTSLKNIGVETGCCSLGDEYCKTTDEYPVTEHGSDVEHGTDGSMDGNYSGEGYRGGR
jgi:hypothetical protein